jgi:hypothetical protein
MRGLTVVTAVVLLGVVSGVAEGQQSVGAPPRVIEPTAREQVGAREAMGMKCLSISAFAAQTLNSREEPTTMPRRRTTRGGLGLGALDASEGMSRPPMEPQLHTLPFDIPQRGQMSFRGAMAVRYAVVPGCTPIQPSEWLGVSRPKADPTPLR